MPAGNPGRAAFPLRLKRLLTMLAWMIPVYLLAVAAGFGIRSYSIPLSESFAMAVAVSIGAVLLWSFLRPVARAAPVAAAKSGSAKWSNVPARRYSDVGGLDREKAEIARIVKDRLARDGASAYGVLRNGILLHGPQGTGKTLLAEATAGEFTLNYYHVPASDLVRRWVGESEATIRATFEWAKAHAPVLLFLDEIDAIAATRQALGSGDDPGGAAKAFNSTLAALMRCIDSYRSVPGLVIMAATNTYDSLDKALIREGRFDLKLRIDFPNAADRERILDARLAKRPSERFSLEEFARRTPGWSGARLCALVDRAANMVADQKRKIAAEDLDRALRETGGADRPHFEPVHWADLVLAPSTEQDLRNLMRLLQPGVAERIGVPVPAGLLLVGQPGTGKSSIGRLIATETRRSFYPITPADILGSGVGASVKRLTEVFERARENSPSIILLDEIDGLLPANHGQLSHHDAQLVEQALILIGGLKPEHNVFLVGTTNDTATVDSRALRGGRFSEKIDIAAPDRRGCERLIERFLGKRAELDSSTTVADLAERLDGVAPAEIEAICHAAKRAAMNRMDHGSENLPPLISEDFQAARRRVQVRLR
jgi:transitional endoplasmic reticulum ATPase